MGRENTIYNFFPAFVIFVTDEIHRGSLQHIAA